MENQIVQEEGFRSSPEVNMNNDMLRVTLDIKILYKYKLRNFINELENRSTEEGEIKPPLGVTPRYIFDEGRFSFLCRSIREYNEPFYLELKVVGNLEESQEITKKFKDKFEGAQLSKERLKKELLILNTSLKRSAWYAVEMRAKSILEDFPDEPHALFALVIARVAQGDLETREEILQHISKLKPDKPDELYNIGRIHKKREEYVEAITTLRKSIKVESVEEPVLKIVSQVQAALSEVNDALKIYEKASKT